MATHQFGGWGYGKLKRRLTSAVSFFKAMGGVNFLMSVINYLLNFPLALSAVKFIFSPA
jgi:hypothetical protein